MSDSSDRNIVIFVFIVAYFYINYIRIKIDIKNDWENMRCNPMNLWTSSFIRDANTANTNFKNCINTLSSDAINKGLQDAYNKQYNALKQINNKETILQGYLGQINNQLTGTGGLAEQYKLNELKIDDIKDKQTTYKTINDLLSSKDPNTNTLHGFTTEIKNIFTKIKEYLPSITST